MNSTRRIAVVAGAFFIAAAVAAIVGLALEGRRVRRIAAAVPLT